MGLYDREYSRYDEPRGSISSPAAWSANTWIIVLNVAVHIIRIFLPKMQTTGRIPLRGDPLYIFGHFSTAEVIWTGGLEFWRFLTFQFLHADGLMHLGFNMLGLYFFGALVEGHLGKRRYLAFYLTCGVFGALLFMLLNAIGLQFGSTNALPFLLTNDPQAPLVGASAGVFGVIMACAYIAPNTMVQMLFPPISLRMKTMAYAYVGLALVNLIFAGKNQGGDAAHIGGAIAGFFFIRHSHLLRDFFDVLGDSRKTKPSSKTASKSKSRGGGPVPPLRLVRPEDDPPAPRPVSRPEPPRDGPSEEELDRVLAKHKAEGPQSLTPQEIEVLRRATQARR